MSCFIPRSAWWTSECHPKRFRVRNIEKEQKVNIDELTIGQAKELAALFAAPQAKTQQPIEHGLKIVVLDKGFVYVGVVTTDGEWVLITNAHNIRRWGTTKGLGQLALSGPMADTKLDPAGTVKVPFHALQHLIAVKADAWKQL